MEETRRRGIVQIATLSLSVALLLGGCGAMMAQLSTGLRQSYQTQQAYDAGFDRYKAGDYARAIPFFRRALELEPTFDDAEAYLAWSYYYIRNYSGATLHFRQALARQPKWEGLHDGLGWSRYHVGRYNLALESFREALALDPRYRDAAVGYAYSLFELGRYAEALPHLERLIREGEGYASQSPRKDAEDVRSRLAWTLFYLGQYEKARDQFLKSLAAWPDWYGLHNGLGWTYLRLGDRRRARASFQRALQLLPNYADAKEGLAQTRP
jgi:tetratricopeptide (TPR) repeat protein